MAGFVIDNHNSLDKADMSNIPSYLVGAAFSGSVFLALHEQLSHRSRLSRKWKLRGEKSTS